MTSINVSSVSQPVETFQRLNVDDQLALLWFIYTEMGRSITPAAPGAAGSEIVENLYNQVKELPHGEQLQVMRDLASQASSPLSREYGALSQDTKLAFWYRLAQGMEDATIVPMPPDYQMSEQAQQLFGEIKRMEFQQQITLLRTAVVNMGADPKTSGI